MKKKKMMRKKKKAKKYFPPMMLVPPPVIEVELPEALEIVCPTCQTFWANATIQFGKPLRKEDFAIRADLKDRMIFQKKTNLPVCPVCAYEYDPHAIYALILAAVNRRNMERKSWKGIYQTPANNPSIPSSPPGALEQP